MTKRQPTYDELMTALPHVLAAPKDEAPIRYLCKRPEFGARDFVDQLEMTKAAGIPGERWLKYPWLKLSNGEPDPSIQVSVLPTRTCDLVWQPGDDGVHPGDPIVADLDTSEENLPTGSLIQAGTAILLVSSVFNNACVKWKVRHGEDALRWVRDHESLRLRGILCSVYQDGSVNKNDRLKVIRRGF